MGSFSADLRYAVRVIRKHPTFSVVAVLAIALGIGANAAIFSVVNAVLLRPLPYADADTLVNVCRQFPSGESCNASIPKFMTWAQAQSFAAVAAYDFSGPGLNLGGAETPEQVRGIHASAGYFRVFGTDAALGRTFTPDEDRPGGARVAVLAHGLWARRFGSDPQILGRSIVLNSDSYTVVGVLPERFTTDPAVDVFIPLQPDPNSTNQGHFLVVGARLKPGVTLEGARAEMKLLGDAFRRANPRWMSNDESATVERMQDVAVRDVRPALLILLGAVALVLLIACANVASLLLARSAARQKEMAVRSAVGAGRLELVRQLLLESLVLSLIGAVLGLVVGVWGAQALLALSPGDLPRATELARAPLLRSLVDWRLLGFTLALSIVTGVLFGLAPALYLSRSELNVALREGGGHGATGARATRLRGLLVVAEVALALVLLVGATLLIRTFVGLRDVNPGFNPHNVLTLRASLAGARYASTGAVERLTRDVTRRIDALPAVNASALAISLPTEPGPDLPLRIEGRPTVGDSPYHGDEFWRTVSPEYFRALAIPLERGRVFTERDTAGSLPVVMINEALARKYWPNGDPVGERITIAKGLGPEFDDPTRQIVGVVGDVRENGLDQPPPPVMYVPAAQLPDGLTRLGNSLVALRFVVRVKGDPAGSASAVAQQFLAIDRDLAVSDVRTFDQLLARSIAQQNFNMLLLTIFGAIALALAAVGVYGLMSYSVEQGTHEIGVRLALGAAPADVRSMIVGRGMRLAIVGVALGLVAAFGLTRVLARLLFGVGTADPATFVGVAGVLLVIALLACYLPARRATRVNPIMALRSE